MTPGAPRPRARLGRREAGLAALVALVLALWPVQGAVFRPDRIFFAVDTGSALLPWSAVQDTPVEVQNPGLSDQGVAFYPSYRWVSRSWRAGDPPAWCPDIYAGAPGFGNAQAGGLDPQVLLPVVLEALLGQVAFDWALGFVAWLRVGLALLGAFLLARRLGLDRAPSALCAVSFGFSGYLQLWLNHPLGHVPPFLPWLLYFLEGIRGPSPRRSGGAAAAMLALAIYGGHAETAFYVGVAGGLWALALLREERVAGLRALGALALGTAAAAVVLLPLSEYLGLSAARAVRLEEAAHATANVDLVSLGALLAVVGIVTGFARQLRQRERAPGEARSSVLAATGVVLALCGVGLLIARRGLGAGASLALVPDLLGAPGTGGYRGPGNYIETGSPWVPVTVLFFALAALVAPGGVVRRRGLIAVLAVVSFLLSVKLPGLLGLYRFVPFVGLGDTVRFASVGSLMLGLLAADALQAAPRISRLVAVAALGLLTAFALAPRGVDALAPSLERSPEENELVGFVTVPPETIPGEHTSLEGWWDGALRLSAARVRMQPVAANGSPLAEPAPLTVPLELFDAPSAAARARADSSAALARAPEGAVWFRTPYLPTGLLGAGHWLLSLELLGADRSPEPVAVRRIRLATLTHPLDRRPVTLLLIGLGALLLVVPAGRYVGWAAVAVALGSGFVFVRGVNPLVPRSASFPPTRTEDILAAELGPYRFFSDPDVLPPDTGLVRGLRGIEGYDAMDVAEFNYYRSYVLPPGVNPLLAWHPRSVDLEHPAFRLYGIGMLAMREAFEHPGWELVAGPEHADESRRAETWLYRARDPMPRAFCVPNVVSLDELGDLVRRDVSAWDPAALASYSGDWRPARPFTEATVDVPVWTNNTVRLTAALDGDGLLVLTDQHFPGWTVTVDGEPAELGAANWIFRGVPLGAGIHEVVFRYEPLSVRLGGWISAVSALGILALLAGLGAGRAS